MIADLKTALIVTRREVRDQFRDWRILLPVVTLTIFFPVLMEFTARQAIGFVEQYGAPIIGERLVPFLLMIVGFFPISVSLVIALESFVGEKERRSIEPLLNCPLSDRALYMGKLLAALVPPLSASYMGILVYLASLYFRINWQPDPVLLIQIFLLTTVQALLMVSGAVVVSSQTTSVRAANLLASFIIIPMALLIQGESIVMFWGRYEVLWWAIIGQILVTGLLIRSGLAYFNREELLGRELDSLNLVWSWGVFQQALRSGAVTIVDWYKKLLFETLRPMRLPVFLISGGLLAGLLIGYSQAAVFTLPAEIVNLDGLDESFIEGLDAISFLSTAGVLTVWLHNVRVLALATILGIFSFGVLSFIVLMFPFIVIGYFMGNVALAGFSPGLFFVAFVLPHGLLEIPALTLAGAAIFRLGATLATPAQGKTIGEALLQALADWTKVLFGLVLPLLLAAAAVEVFITPQVIVRILGG